MQLVQVLQTNWLLLYTGQGNNVSLAASPRAARAGPANTQGYYCIQDRGQRFFRSQSSCSSYRSCKRIRLLL